MAEERKGSFWKGLLGTEPVETGPVAQRIRARGYEPRCRGFESLLAHKQPQKGRASGRKNGRDNDGFSVLAGDGATEVLRIQDKVTARRAVYHHDRCQVEVQ
eukprot:Gb_32958 [translate_table: standard]